MQARAFRKVCDMKTLGPAIFLEFLYPRYLRPIGIERQEGHVLNNPMTGFELVKRAPRSVAARTTPVGSL